MKRMSNSEVFLVQATLFASNNIIARNDLKANGKTLLLIKEYKDKLESLL
jgi:hypothetical protein